MSVLLSAISSELTKIAESEEKQNKSSYLRAVVAGLPVVAAQAASDIPESMIERGVQNTILRSAGLPKAGKLLNVGALRFGSRLGAGALTTPVFVSGMKDISEAKDKKQERRGLAKLVGAGAAYSALRGGIESALDTEYAHMPYSARLKRVVGPRALRGVASAAATGLMVGRNLKRQKKDSSFTTKYVQPALIGAGMAGLSGLYEGVLAEGVSTPKARWRVGAKVGGKAVAGAAATLFLSELMKRALQGKEKKAAVDTAPTPSSINQQAAAWARSASTQDLLQFHTDLLRRGGERSPSNRAALYALHDELGRRGVSVPAPELRSSVQEKVRSPTPVDAALIVGVSTTPGLAWSALSSLPQSDRDKVLVDALDRLYIEGKINKITEGVPRGGGYALLQKNTLAVAKDVDAAELAHEIGHLRAGDLRKTLLHNQYVGQAHAIGRASSILIPTYVMVASMDPSYSTKEELRSKAKAMSALGVVAAAAQTPVLAEELIASTKGLKYLADAGATKKELVAKTIKVLGPAFGTYAAPATIPFVAAALLRRRAQAGEKR